MGTETFESSTFSLILTWIFSIPIILSILNAIISHIFEVSREPTVFSFWIFLCLLVLSPIRYIFLQIFMANAYAFQSLSSLLNLFFLALFVPIVFGILYFVGIISPIYLTYTFSGLNKKLAPIRYWLAGIIAPILFIVFSYFFYLALPYAGYATSWLHPKNVIKSTNGPASLYFEYVVEDLTPLTYTNYVHQIGLNNMSAKERLRAHVASVYLSNRGNYYYVRNTYPELVKK